MSFKPDIDDSIVDRLYTELANSNLHNPDSKLFDLLDQLYNYKLERDAKEQQ